MTTPYALSLFERIKKKNKKRNITVDLMMEGKTYRATAKIAAAIKELQAQGLITYNSIQEHGRFATELVFEGATHHSKIPQKLRKEEDDNEPKKPTRKYQKRKVRRSAI
jgi:hypothetical protein